MTMIDMPPHDTEAEKAVLGCLLISHDLLDDVLPTLAPEHFYHAAHQDIYRALLALHQDRHSLDAIAVHHRMAPAGDDALFNMLVQLQKEEYLFSRVPENVKSIRACALLRELRRYGAQVVADTGGDESAEAVLERAEARLFTLGTQVTGGTDSETLETLSYTYHARFNDLYHHKGAMTGLPSGLSSLDYRLRGLHPATMIVIAGRPGMGKTSLALSLAHHAALRLEKRVAFFSLEMSKHELFNRLVAMRAHVDSQKLETPWELTPAEYDRAIAAQTELESPNLLIDDESAMSIATMRAKARRLKARYGIDLLFIDYVQLLHATDERGRRITPRNEEVAEISRAVKALAKELDIPIIALAQLSRAVDTHLNKIPQLSDLKESGQLEQDADVVMMLYSEEQDNPDSTRKGQVDVLFRKHRSGVKDAVATLHYEAPYTLFTDIERRVGV